MSKLLPINIQEEIRVDERLKYLQYLVIAGSHAYGTNIESSDIDIRGWYFPPVYDLLGIGYKIEDSITYKDSDMVFYTFHKFIHLLAQCNPNVIEQVGLSDECIIYKSHPAQVILNNIDLFLSKRVYHTFGGYAYTMLKRFEQGNTPESTMGHRNHKSTVEKQQKHLMHLIRLYYTGIDILKNHQVLTNRVKEHDLLMSIRHGEVPVKYVFELRDKLELEMQEAYEESTLPHYADMNTINSLVVEITTDYIKCPERFIYID